MDTTFLHESALEELHSHLPPNQFSYLLTTLSATKLNKDDNGQDSYNYCSSTTSHTTPSKNEYIPSGRNVGGNKGKIVQLAINANYALSSTIRKSAYDHVQALMVNPATKECEILDSPVSSSGFQPFQLSTTICSGSSSSHSFSSSNHNFSPNNRGGVKSSHLINRDSSIDREEIEKNVNQVMTKYKKLSLSSDLYFQGKVIKTTEPTNDTKTCSQLRVCKKLCNKYPSEVTQQLRRSSSTETVKAESLPDTENVLLPIAGKIANTSSNPFSYMRQKNSKPIRTATISTSTRHPPNHNFKDRYKIEQEIDKSLNKLQDYKNVSDFFQNNKSRNNSNSCANGHKTLGNGKALAFDLSKAVTNPLYKKYDPTGYHKSDDELAKECIQTVCNDFNAWVQSLSGGKEKAETNSNGSDEAVSGNDEIFEENIVPEFLINILRTELELPASNE